jgi:hypothetical protein
MIRTIINSDVKEIKMILLDWIIIIGVGINKTISMSKTIKITASRKNRVENGIRAELDGSNPHSKGEVFSRSRRDRINNRDARRRIANGIIAEIKEEIDNKFIN